MASGPTRPQRLVVDFQLPILSNPTSYGRRRKLFLSQLSGRAAINCETDNGVYVKFMNTLSAKRTKSPNRTQKVPPDRTDLRALFADVLRVVIEAIMTRDVPR